MPVLSPHAFEAAGHVAGLIVLQLIETGLVQPVVPIFESLRVAVQYNLSSAFSRTALNTKDPPVFVDSHPAVEGCHATTAQGFNTRAGVTIRLHGPAAPEPQAAEDGDAPCPPRRHPPDAGLQVFIEQYTLRDLAVSHNIAGSAGPMAQMSIPPFPVWRNRLSS